MSRLAAFALVLAATACLPRERPVAAEWTRPGAAVRVWERGAASPSDGALARPRAWGAAGGLLGAALLAMRPSAVGGAIGLAVGSAGGAGVFAGQQAEASRTPNAWRVVYPRPAD